MSERSLSRGWLVLAALAGFVAAPGRLTGEDPQSQVERRSKEARRAAMRRLVESFEVVRRDGERRDRCTLDSTPVMYFSDPVYHPEIGEGTMWVWTCEGRPQVIAQVYNWGPRDHWTMGLYSFASARISFTDEAGVRSEYRETDFRPIPIGATAPPAATQALRTRRCARSPSVSRPANAARPGMIPLARGMSCGC